MTDKLLSVVETTQTTSGQRTAMCSVFQVGATVPPHYHTRYSETFNVLEGEVIIYADGAEIELMAGESATIPANTIHYYEVRSRAVIEIILNPGYRPFEQAIEIVTGTQADGIYSQTGELNNDNLLFMAVMADMSDTHYVFEAGEKLNAFIKANEAEVANTRAEWIEKYCGR